MPVTSALDRLVAFRRTLHRHPELSGAEAETARAVLAFTADTRPDRVLSGMGGHGVVLVYDSGTPGPTALFRAELDALPITETGTVAYRSRRAGVAHLCGHDGHMAILCGLALRLGQQRPARGRAVLLFQPAEETGVGAAAVLADRRLEGLHPDWAFALHNLPGMDHAAVAVAAGPAHCASKGVRITLEGRCAHAATPHSGCSPAPCTARLALALPELSSAAGSVVPGFRQVTLCHMRAGARAFGVTPGSAELWLTLRSATDSDLSRLDAELRAHAAREAATDGLGIDFAEMDHFPACSNDPDAAARMARAARSAGLRTAHTALPLRASEDFGRFGAGARSAMALLGAGADVPSLHSSDYDFPDTLIPPGVNLLAAILEELLGWQDPAPRV